MKSVRAQVYIVKCRPHPEIVIPFRPADRSAPGSLTGYVSSAAPYYVNKHWPSGKALISVLVVVISIVL